MKKIHYLIICLAGILSVQSCSDDADEIGATPLATPDGVEYTATYDSAAFIWSAVGGADSYMAQVKDSDGVIDEKKVTDNTVTFNGLEAETLYSFRVKAQAKDPALDSEYTAWIEFKTNEIPAIPVLSTPEDLDVEDLAPTSASVVWTAVEEASGYLLEVKDPSQTVTEHEADDAGFELTGLEPETAYSVRVRALGDDENWLDSEFTEWKDFTTTESDVALNFASGTGTQADPYIIKTPGQMFLMAQKVNSKADGFVDAHYKLGADIDLAGRKWTPIGTGLGSFLNEGTFENTFKGVLDGANYTIKNLDCVVTANDDSCLAGLFGLLESGQVLNVNVEGSVVSSSTFSGSNGYAFAAGICAFMDAGKIDNCSYTGSVKATSTTDNLVRTYAAGICGMHNRGSQTNCEVTVPADCAIESIGANSGAGGITGYVYNCPMDGFYGHKSNIQGTVRADIIDFVDQTYVAIDANAGGIASATFSIFFSDCQTDISGSVIANSPYGAANAGGICAGTEADSFAGQVANISGSVEARSGTSAAYAAGILARAQGAYGLGGCQATISGKISSISEADNQAAYVGGVAGNIGNPANPIGSSGCHTIMKGGTLYAESLGNIFCGGVIAQTSGTLKTASMNMDQASKIELNGGIQYFGGVIAGAASCNLTACYAILDGTVTATSTKIIQIGGIASGLGGATAAQTRSATACYTLIDGTITATTDANKIIGAIVGGRTRAAMNSDWWWCGNTSATQAHGGNASAPGATKLDARNQASLETAMTQMNQTLADLEYPARYKYDSAKGHLILEAVAQE